MEAARADARDQEARRGKEVVTVVVVMVVVVGMVFWEKLSEKERRRC